MAEFIEFPALAAGWNNQALVTPLHWISPPLFAIYDEHIETTFRPHEGRKAAASGKLEPIALPNAIWKLPALTQAELQLVRTTFSLTRESARVTMRMYNPIEAAWQNFNCWLNQIETPDTAWNGAEWRDIEFTFTNMRLIT